MNDFSREKRMSFIREFHRILFTLDCMFGTLYDANHNMNSLAMSRCDYICARQFKNFLETQMKHITIFLFAAMLMGGCDHSHNNAKTSEEPTQEFYGAEFTIENPIPVSELISKVSGTDTLETQIEGIIEKTCPGMGCWMTLKLENGQTLRVTTDHKFFVPVGGCEGLRAVVKGRAFNEVIPVEDLKHYAEEEGKSPEEIAAITEPAYELAFVADGAMIEGYVDDGTHVAKGCSHDHGEHDHDHDHDH